MLLPFFGAIFPTRRRTVSGFILGQNNVVDDVDDAIVRLHLALDVSNDRFEVTKINDRTATRMINGR